MNMLCCCGLTISCPLIDRIHLYTSFNVSSMTMGKPHNFPSMEHRIVSNHNKSKNMWLFLGMFSELGKTKHRRYCVPCPLSAVTSHHCCEYFQCDLHVFWTIAAIAIERLIESLASVVLSHDNIICIKYIHRICRWCLCYFCDGYIVISYIKISYCLNNFPSFVFLRWHSAMAWCGVTR